MKTIAEYLEQEVHFVRMAAEATDPKLKESLQKQAAAYRKLAETRGTFPTPFFLAALVAIGAEIVRLEDI